MVSPPKKVPRTTATGDVSTQGGRIIEILDSPPQSPSIRSHIPLPSTNVVALPNASVQKAWPTGFYVCEHLEAWDKYKQYKDAYGRNKASIPKLWPELFPGSKYVKTTVTSWRGVWDRAPGDLIHHFASEGRTQGGSWEVFLDAVRARSEGRPTNFAHLVKNEPQADAASASTSAPHILEAPATIPAVVPDPHTFPLAFKPDIPVPVASSSEVLGQPPELCAFCDTQVTVRPSLKLDQLLANILALTRPSPTPQNPMHRTASSSQVYAEYCRQHATDSRLLPLARACGWPEEIDYSHLRERVVITVLPTLQDMLEDIQASDFYHDSISGEFKKSTA
jgi:hypothetical protein